MDDLHLAPERLPLDAHSERFPRVLPEHADEAALALRSAILSGRRQAIPGQFSIERADGSLEGPFGLFLFAPSVGAPLQALGASLRTATSLSGRERELAIVAAAAELDSGFELWAHVPVARAAGIDAELLNNVIAGRTLPVPREDALVRFCRAQAVSVDPSAEFVELMSFYDRQALFEIVALVAYYRGLASMLALFGIRAPGRSAEVD